MTAKQAISGAYGIRSVALVLVTLFVPLSFVERPAEGASPPGAITKGPWIQHVSADGAVVRVEVEPKAPVSVELGLGMAAGDAGDHRVFIQSSDARTLHTINVTGLEPGTHYSYSVKVGATSKFAAFTTAPRDAADAPPFRFLVYGDTRTDHAAHAAVVRAMMASSSDFLVHTGDFVEEGSSLQQWQTFFDLEAPLLGARYIFSCVGNHELTDGSGIAYARFFGPVDPSPPSSSSSGAQANPSTTPPALPAPHHKIAHSSIPTVVTRPDQLASTARWGNARFFFVNGVVSHAVGSPDRSWLEKALSDADGEPNLAWRIVVIHHGLWSSGPHGKNARLHDAGIPALLKAHKVDLVISGHDHIYERGWGDGLAYIVSGGGGAPVYKVKNNSNPFVRKVEAARHFVEVNVSPSSLQLVATRVDGSTIERCALGRERAGWDCDGAAGLSSSAAGTSANRPDGGSSYATSRWEALSAYGILGAVFGTISLLGLGMWIARRRRRVHHERD